MRRAFLLLTGLIVLSAAPDAHALTRVSSSTWDRAEQGSVMESGVMAPLGDGRFHGEEVLSGGQARDALHVLATLVGQPPLTDVADGRRSVFAFDRLLVAQLGLADVADAVQREARDAGLRPPAPFGDEVVARMLGLRHDQPYGSDRLELYPWEAITRAEAAWSLARAQAFADGAGPWMVRDELSRFVLPHYTARQLRPLRIAVAKIGMPYVWGGETDRRSTFFGGQVHGGYDCSGFAWRVFKLSGLPEGPQITGRTAAAQSSEIPRAARLRLADIAPADLLFFGPGRFWQKATEKRIDHMGIALSKDFMIQSSGSYGGVSVAPLFTPTRAAAFSWARRLR